MREIKFDDIAALKEVVSEDYGDWGPEFEITQEIIQQFADLTGDHQWIHVDVERAKQGPFGAPIAHGLLTLALTTRVRPPADFVAVGQGNTVNYGSDGFRFLVPVVAGSKIHARMRVLEVEAHAKGTRITMEIAVHIVGNERPSLVYKAVVLHAPPAA